MRMARVKIETQDTWYHCINRLSGVPGELPLGEADKEMFVRMLRRMLELYTVEVVSYAVMSNHFHLLVRAPSARCTEEEASERYERFYRGRRRLEVGSRKCGVWRDRLRDVSWFMRHLEQVYTQWYNRTKGRRGGLWSGRFKSVVLESGRAVWACWKYIELNAVRAGLVTSAGRYRHCAYGAWCQSGRHLMEGRMRGRLEVAGVDGLEEAMECLRREIGGEDVEGGSRVRYWTEGVVIGSRLFVVEVMSRVRPGREVARWRRRNESDGQAYHAWQSAVRA